jgi:hypothetical protein
MLDLSNVSEWLNTSYEVAQTIIPASVLDLISSIDYEKMYSDTLEYLINSYDSVGLFVTREILESEFDIHLCEKYPTIKGFHACRVTDESSYRKQGIVALNKEILFELAIERFGQHASVDEITDACEKTCIKANEDNVFFFPSLENAKKSSQNHYLKCGSETLQGLSADLGLACRGILSKQGKSCIIECEIPTEQLDDLYRFDIWRNLITFSLQKANGRKFKNKTPDWGYATYGTLKPEFIIKFHYIEEYSFIYRLPRH